MTVTLPAGDFDTHPGSDPHPSLYNEDLAPLPEEKRRWGAFEFFNVWTNDVQSLAGYTLAASLFITAGINGWWVFAAIILAGFFVNFLVNLTGKPSVKYGIPYAVMARSSMGVRGAQFPRSSAGSSRSSGTARRPTSPRRPWPSRSTRSSSRRPRRPSWA